MRARPPLSSGGRLVSARPFWQVPPRGRKRRGRRASGGRAAGFARPVNCGRNVAGLWQNCGRIAAGLRRPRPRRGRGGRSGADGAVAGRAGPLARARARRAPTPRTSTRTRPAASAGRVRVLACASAAALRPRRVTIWREWVAAAGTCQIRPPLRPRRPLGLTRAIRRALIARALTRAITRAMIARALTRAMSLARAISPREH